MSKGFGVMSLIGRDKSWWVKYDLLAKDPFHLPRGLILAIKTLERLTKNGAS